MEKRKSENSYRIVLHDKSEIGGGFLPIVAKAEGEVVCTYSHRNRVSGFIRI